MTIMPTNDTNKAPNVYQRARFYAFGPRRRKVSANIFVVGRTLESAKETKASVWPTLYVLFVEPVLSHTQTLAHKCDQTRGHQPLYFGAGIPWLRPALPHTDPSWPTPTSFFGCKHPGMLCAARPTERFSMGAQPHTHICPEWETQRRFRAAKWPFITDCGVCVRDQKCAPSRSPAANANLRLGWNSTRLLGPRLWSLFSFKRRLKLLPAKTYTMQWLSLPKSKQIYSNAFLENHKWTWHIFLLLLSIDLTKGQINNLIMFSHWDKKNHYLIWKFQLAVCNFLYSDTVKP